MRDRRPAGHRLVRRGASRGSARELICGSPARFVFAVTTPPCASGAARTSSGWCGACIGSLVCLNDGRGDPAARAHFVAVRGGPLPDLSNFFAARRRRGPADLLCSASPTVGAADFRRRLNIGSQRLFQLSDVGVVQIDPVGCSAKGELNAFPFSLGNLRLIDVIDQLTHDSLCHDGPFDRELCIQTMHPGIRACSVGRAAHQQPEMFETHLAFLVV